MANDPTAARSGSVFTTNPAYTGAWICYINRVAVPIQGFNVTHGVWTIPQFQIQLVPDVTLMRLGNEDLVEVAVFYLDQWIDPERPKWCLLCDGEIVGWQFQNTPNGRVMSFDCIAHIHIFQQLYFYFMSSVEDVVAGQDPSLQASGFVTQGLSYPASLFHRGLLVSQADADATNNRNTNASPNPQEIIKAPFEFVYNVIRGTIGKEVPNERRALPMMNFFARHIRQTNFHNRWVRLPIFEDRETLAERRGVFPIFEAARNDQALLAMQRHSASPIANSGPVWDLFQHVLRLVHMEISMIPNPACVQVALDPEQDGKILRLLENATALVDIRNPGQAARVENRRAARPAQANALDERIARMAIEFGREPTVREVQDQIGHTRTTSTFDVEDGAGGRTTAQQERVTQSTAREAQQAIEHYRATLNALPHEDRDPVNLLSDQDRAASETREITTYDVAIARAVQRDGQLPRPDESGFSAGMLNHYRETLYRTNQTPAGLAQLPVQGQDGSQGIAVVAQTRVGARVQAFRAEQARVRGLHEQQAERERQDRVNQQSAMQGVDPLSPVRLAQYSIKPKFLFGQPPACNIIYPSMIDSWALTEDYKAQPTRVYINDSVMTRLLRADGTNRELMLHALTVGYPEEANAVMHHRISTTTGARAAGSHETGKNLLIWPREFYEGPKVARMELSSWFQTLIQWRNNQGGSTVAPASNRAPITGGGAPVPSNIPPAGAARPTSGRSYRNGRPDAYASEYRSRNMTRWNGPEGAEFRRQAPIFFGGGVAPQLFVGFSSGADQYENTRTNAQHTLEAHFICVGLLGIEQPEVGPLPYPAANPPPCPHGRRSPNTWFLHHEKPKVRRALGGHNAPLSEGSWRNLDAQLAIGLSNLEGKRRSVVSALRDKGIRPVGDEDPWTLIMMMMAWSTGAAGVAHHVGHFARILSPLSGAQRWGALVRALYEAGQQGTLPSGPPRSHRRNPYYSLIRGMQKVEASRQLALSTGSNLSFFDDGISNNEERGQIYDGLARLAYIGDVSQVARQGRVQVQVPATAPVPSTLAAERQEVSPVHDRDDPGGAGNTDAQTVSPPATRVIERPTADSTQTVLPATGLITTTTTSGVPQGFRAEVDVAALAGETDPFAKTFYLYAQQAYFDQRYAARNSAVNLRFNPYIVAGYPGVVFDTQRTAFHVVGYVHRVNHAASIGPPGSMQTSLTFTAVRTFYEFLADVRQDAELFARRVSSAPAEIIPEIREIIQVEGPATEYYRRLFYGGADTPSGAPAAFNFQHAVGMDRGAQGVIPIEMSEETITRRAVVDPDAPQPLDAAVVREADAAIRAQEALVRELESDSIVEVGRGARSSNTAGVREARAQLAELQRRRETLIRGAQDNAQRPYNPQVVSTSSTRVRHNIEPNDEFSPLPDYVSAFEEYHSAMHRAARPVCTLEQYIRFYYGGQTIGALEQQGILRDPVMTFAYAAITTNDVSTSGSDTVTPVERPSALYWRVIGHLRPGPGPNPSPNERGYTDSPVSPVSDTAGVAEDYPQTRADWEQSLFAYADRVRNIRFER